MLEFDGAGHAGLRAVPVLEFDGAGLAGLIAVPVLEFDGAGLAGLRTVPVLLYWAKLLAHFLSSTVFFFLSVGWYCVAVVFGLIGCKLLPTSF